jgi:hypothetical protein
LNALVGGLVEGLVALDRAAQFVASALGLLGAVAFVVLLALHVARGWPAAGEDDGDGAGEGGGP